MSDAAEAARTAQAAQGAAYSYSENIKHSRMNFFVMLLAQLYCLITIETTQDAALLSNSLTQNLPVLETAISIETFYLLAPLLLLIVFFHFQVHLKAFWLAAAKMTRKEGGDLNALVDTYPWFVTSSIAQRLSDDPEENRGFSAVFEYGAGLFFGWFSTAIVLFMMWARFLTKHDWGMSVYHALLVAIAISGAVYFLFATRTGVRGVRVRGWGFFGRGLAVSLAFLAPFMALLALTWWLFEAQDRSGCQVEDADFRPACAQLFQMKETLRSAGLDSRAALAGVDVSERPDGWFPEAEPAYESLASVRGADLRGQDLRYAEAEDAVFVRADLRDALLRLGRYDNAWFQAAEMEDADLTSASFRGANFDHARLIEARLTGSDFSEGSFYKAQLIGAQGDGVIAIGASFKEATAQGCAFRAGSVFSRAVLDDAAFRACAFENAQFDAASLRRTSFAGATLSASSFNDAVLTAAELATARLSAVEARRANLATADLYNVRITDGSVFASANFEDAVMLEAEIRDSDFAKAGLRRADLRRARLESVGLAGADLTGANLFEATLRDVDLGQAAMEAANLSGADLSTARNLTQAQLDRACGDAATKLPAGLSTPSCRR